MSCTGKLHVPKAVHLGLSLKNEWIQGMAEPHSRVTADHESGLILLGWSAVEGVALGSGL